MGGSDANVQKVLDSVISAGQASRKSVGIAQIERMIAAQPEVSGPVTVRDVRGTAKVGASSGIVIFTADYDDGRGRRARDLVLRHAPGSEGRIFFKYDLGRQFRVQKALQATKLPVPEPLWLDESGEHLGLPGYIMTPVAGEAPNPSAFARGPLADASPADREAMLDAALGALAAVHQLDFKAAGLADFAMPAEGATPMQRCINWYWQTWEWIQDPHYARLVPVRRWLLDNAPAGGETLIHGDSTLHNYLFVGNQLTGMLDWEMSCIGRPESDIALQTLGNELFAAPPDSGITQPPSQNEWLERYARVGGRPLASLDYYRRFSGYMILIALISLQRGVPAEARASQGAFIERLWRAAEG
jgi:aminoglycoside phosphotransferase (APT) family kinase protein